MTRPQYDLRELIRLYQSGLSQEEVGRRIGITQTSVGDALRRSGIPARGHGKRRYRLNERYFSSPSSEMAYWLGFLAADGFLICSGGRQGVGIGVRLAACDAEHLKKLAACLDTDSPVRLRPPNVAELRVHSQRLARDVQRLGIVANKSHNCVPWEPPPALAADYWRGVIDGDGHISATSDGYMALAGTRAMCEGFLGYARQVCGTAATAHHASGPAWTVMLTGRRQVHALLTALYEGNGVALDRKKTRAMQIISVPYQRRTRRPCSDKEVCSRLSIARGLCGKHYQREMIRLAKQR